MYDEIQEDDLVKWRKLAEKVGLNFFYEHHPKKNWFKNSNDETSDFDNIIRMADPFLKNGAKMLVLDHEEFELQNNWANRICKILARPESIKGFPLPILGISNN